MAPTLERLFTIGSCIARPATVILAGKRHPPGLLGDIPEVRDMTKEPVIIKLHPEPEEYLEAETAFLRAVGLCITRWAFVDRQLFWLFRFGLGAATHRAAIVYYNQQTISRRLSQVDELLKGLFSDARWQQEGSEWQRLRSR